MAIFFFLSYIFSSSSDRFVIHCKVNAIIYPVSTMKAEF